MSALGDVLELMHGARSGYRTIHLRARDWRHNARSIRAAQRWEEIFATGASATQVLLIGETDEPLPDIEEIGLSVWRAPGRARAETRRGDDVHLTVITGERWWVYMPGMGSITNDGDPAHGAGAADELNALLDPSLLLPHLDLEIDGGAEAAGDRPAIRVRARPRPPRLGDPGLLSVPLGADEYELLVDAERGILLRIESRIDGDPFAVTEILGVAFDEDLPPALFVFEPPDGRPARPASEAFPRHEDTSLHEATRRAPFAVFVPTLVPEDTELHVTFISPDEPSGERVSLHLSYAHHAYNLSVVQSSASTSNEWGDEGWIDHGAVRVREVHGQRHAMLERGGTRIFLIAHGIDEPDLIGVAESLVPASPDPPRLVPAEPESAP